MFFEISKPLLFVPLESHETIVAAFIGMSSLKVAYASRPDVRYNQRVKAAGGTAFHHKFKFKLFRVE